MGSPKNKNVIARIFGVVAIIAAVGGFSLFRMASGDGVTEFNPTPIPTAAPTEMVTPDGTQNYESVTPIITESPMTEEKVPEGLVVYVFDVGQADSILIYSGDDIVLIDAGNNDNGEPLAKYIKDELGITQIDYAIATHPHADHIGGFDDIIDAFEIGKVYMPDTELTTKVYKSVMKSLKAKGLKEETPKVGSTFDIGDLGVLTVMSVEDDYEELNFTSIVLRLDYGDSSFIFTGDAIVENEQEILNSPLKFELDADILKVGHHGSDTSSSPEFLSAITPNYSIITCGKGNKYKLPTTNTLDKLKNIGSDIYRTDELGTIKIEATGINGEGEYTFTFLDTDLEP